MIIDPGIFLGAKPQAQSAPILLATVVSIGEHGIILRFDGDVQPGQKHYKCLSSYSPVVGDRVLVAMMGGSGVVLGVAGVESGGSTPPSEWIAVSGTVTYNSVDNPTGVINVPSGHGIGVGNKIKLANGGNTIYGKITAVTATTVTFLHEINPSTSLARYLLQNSAITDVYYSREFAPAGFPTSAESWTVYRTDTSSRMQASPTLGTWYNIGGVSLTVPIGKWEVSYDVVLHSDGTGSEVNVFCTLSTANNSESNPKMSVVYGFAGSPGYIVVPVTNKKDMYALAAKTTLYLNTMATAAGVHTLYNRNDLSALVIKAACLY